MNKMRVYHISLDYLGENPIFSPRIPFNDDMGMKCILKEDTITPRICVCPTILGCMRAIGLPIDCDNEIEINVYEAYIDVKFIYQPTLKDV